MSLSFIQLLNFTKNIAIYLVRLTSKQPPNGWVTTPLSLEIMWTEHEADGSPPPSADVKYKYSYISTYTYVFTAYIRDNLKMFSLRSGLSLKQFGSQILEVTLTSKCNKVSLKQQGIKSKFKLLA